MKEHAISGGRLPERMLSADDLNRMSARKLIYRCMVCAPALFLAGLGVHARALSNTYDTVADDPVHERDILAYVPFIRESDAIRPTPGNLHLQDARIVAQHWVSAAERGTLKPLVPIAFEDTSTEGPKSEVFEESSRLESVLTRGVALSLAHKDYSQAVSDALLSTKLASILKQSDFASIFNSSSQQRRVIHLMIPAVSKLSELDRARLSQLGTICTTESSSLDEIAERGQRLYVEWRARRGFTPLSIEDTRLLGDIMAYVQRGDSVTVKQIRDRLFASNDDNAPSYCSSLRLGVGEERLLAKDVAALTSALNVKRAPR